MNYSIITENKYYNRMYINVQTVLLKEFVKKIEIATFISEKMKIAKEAAVQYVKKSSKSCQTIKTCQNKIIKTSLVTKE